MKAPRQTAPAKQPARPKRVTARTAATAARRATLAKTCKSVDDSTVVDDSDAVGVALATKAVARNAAKTKPTTAGKSRGPSGVTRTAVDRAADPPPATGLVLLERVVGSIEREINQIEAIVGGSHLKPKQRSEAERRARTLASLARTLAEVRRLRATEQSRAADDDAIPRDLDEFRRALSRRLEQLVADAAQPAAAGDE